MYYVCIDVYMYVLMYVHIYVRSYVCVYVCTYVRTCVCVCVCVIKKTTSEYGSYFIFCLNTYDVNNEKTTHYVHVGIN